MLQINKNFNNKHNISIVCADAGRSYITYFMLKSLLRFNINFKIYIICNKDNEYLSLLNKLAELYQNIILIYNFNYCYSTYYNENEISKHHISSINYVLKNYINTDYVLLIDNDIIFKNNFNIFFDLLNKPYYIIGDLYKLEDYADWIIKYPEYNKINKNNINNAVFTNTYLNLINYYNIYYRFSPYLFLFNYTILKNIIPNFDNVFCYTQFEHINNIYIAKDTLAELTTTIITNNIPYKQIKISDYVIHMQAGSYATGITLNSYIEYISQQYKEMNQNIDHELISIC